MDQAERDRLNIIFKIVVALCLSLCYIIYEYTRQANFPTLIQECQTACESYGRLDYTTYGRCQCAPKYTSLNDLEEKDSDTWPFLR